MISGIIFIAVVAYVEMGGTALGKTRTQYEKELVEKEILLENKRNEELCG